MESRVQICDHLSRDTIVFDMRIAVRETTPLLSELVSSHFDFSCSLNQFLQIFRHRTSPVSAIIYNLGCS